MSNYGPLLREAFAETSRISNSGFEIELDPKGSWSKAVTRIDGYDFHIGPIRKMILACMIALANDKRRLTNPHFITQGLSFQILAGEIPEWDIQSIKSDPMLYRNRYRVHITEIINGAAESLTQKPGVSSIVSSKDLVKERIRTRAKKGRFNPITNITSHQMHYLVPPRTAQPITNAGSTCTGRAPAGRYA